MIARVPPSPSVYHSVRFNAAAPPDDRFILPPTPQTRQPSEPQETFTPQACTSTSTWQPLRAPRLAAAALALCLSLSALASPIAAFTNLAAWHQGNRNNCTTVAFTKAANAVHGPQLFSKTETDGSGGYRLLTQEQRTYEISKSQLQKASRAADFRGAGPSKAQAELTVAALAQCHSQDHGLTYEQALQKRMDQGVGTGELARCLGIPYYDFRNPPDALEHMKTHPGARAGTVGALFRFESRVTGHEEAVLRRSDGTIVGDSYGQIFVENVRRPTILVEGQHVEASNATVLAERWEDLPTEARAKNLQETAMEHVNSPSPVLQERAFSLMSAGDAEGLSDSDRDALRLAFRDHIRDPRLVSWLGEAARHMSEKGARAAYGAQLRHLNYSDHPRKHMAGFVREVLPQLSLAEVAVVSQNLLEEGPVWKTSHDMAVSVRALFPKVSPQARTHLISAGLMTIRLSGWSTEAEKDLARQAFRGNGEQIFNRF